jgi:hypothetical protein
VIVCFKRLIYTSVTMALPGLGLDLPMPILVQTEATEHELAANTEWRFEVASTTSDDKQQIELKVTLSPNIHKSD